MFVTGSNRKELENKGVSCICLHRCAVLEMVAPICSFAPVSFLQGKAESCLPLVKRYDQRCRLPYQKLSGHPIVLSSCERLATSRHFLSSRTTWASPMNDMHLASINDESSSKCSLIVRLIINASFVGVCALRAEISILTGQIFVRLWNFSLSKCLKRSRLT